MVWRRIDIKVPVPWFIFTGEWSGPSIGFYGTERPRNTVFEDERQTPVKQPRLSQMIGECSLTRPNVANGGGCVHFMRSNYQTCRKCGERFRWAEMRHGQFVPDAPRCRRKTHLQVQSRHLFVDAIRDDWPPRRRRLRANEIMAARDSRAYVYVDNAVLVVWR